MKPALVLLALALACGKALAADAPHIIQRMLAAADTLSYRGHVVQIEGDQAQSLHILHRAGADGGLDRVRSLQGTYWELRREDKTAVSPCQQPDRHTMRHWWPQRLPACCRAGCKSWPSLRIRPGRQRSTGRSCCRLHAGPAARSVPVCVSAGYGQRNRPAAQGQPDRQSGQGPASDILRRS